ncbi:hypothetical protein B566_EDAN003579 [Ephemera danica]|nr:hypothetical protein B566_EDAN003579 [Ephemera danica]
MRSLQTYARVPCGYAAVKDVRTSAHEDRMDSFVLAETFKYLFLLFADPGELVLDLDEFLFTTEAHLLPLSLARRTNYSTTAAPITESRDSDDLQFSRTCPNTLHLFPESVRRPLKNMVNGICPRRSARRKLHAVQFQVGNPDHMKAVRDMGIAIITLPDGRLQLLHTFANARSPGDAEEGLQFMQEMVELSRSQSQTPDSAPLSVSFTLLAPGSTIEQKVSLSAGPAHFGQELRGEEKVTARVAITDPLKVCGPLVHPERLKGRIAVMERGDCMFIEKARKVEQAGAVAAIVLDNTAGSSARTSPMFAMSGDGKNDIKIPLAFLFQQDAFQLLQALALDPSLRVTISDASPEEKKKHQGMTDNAEEALMAEASESMDSHLLESILEKLKGSVRDFLTKQQTPKDSSSQNDSLP